MLRLSVDWEEVPDRQRNPNPEESLLAWPALGVRARLLVELWMVWELRNLLLEEVTYHQRKDLVAALF